MANYKVVDADELDSGLKSVADKMREKSGTTDKLIFPAGFENLIDSLASQYYATRINQSSNTQNISFDIGFEPRLFVIATVNGFANSSTGTYYITSFWHCADLTAQGDGEYTGGLALRSGQIISYDARNYYSYSNGIVTIKDTAHYFKANTLYRVFAMA